MNVYPLTCYLYQSSVFTWAVIIDVVVMQAFNICHLRALLTNQITEFLPEDDGWSILLHHAF